MDKDMENKLGYIASRLREKSTYSGMIVVVSMALPLAAHYVPQLGMANATDVVTWVSWIGMGIGGLMSMFLPENGKH